MWNLTHKLADTIERGHGESLHQAKVIVQRFDSMHKERDSVIVGGREKTEEVKQLVDVNCVLAVAMNWNKSSMRHVILL